MPLPKPIWILRTFPAGLPITIGLLKNSAGKSRQSTFDPGLSHTTKNHRPTAATRRKCLTDSKTRIRKKGDEPEQVLTKMGFTPEKLRAAIALPLSWNIYAQREITPAKLQEFFAAHREELDGTRVEASHILLKLPKNPGSDNGAASQTKLTALREKILAGDISFTEAAAQHSDAPSKNEGGKLATSAYRGKMPLALTQQVFPLKTGEISAPFQTPFGVHIVTLNQKHPGQFSLEDVRGEIFKTLSRTLWDTTIQNLRSKAKIEWNTDSTN